VAANGHSLADALVSGRTAGEHSAQPRDDRFHEPEPQREPALVDERLRPGDNVHDHTGANTHHRKLHGHQRDNAWHRSDFHAPRASDAAVDEYHGYGDPQSHINAYRAAMDPKPVKLPLAHPQNVDAAADQHAHWNRETGGAKEFKRGGSAVTTLPGGDALMANRKDPVQGALCDQLVVNLTAGVGTASCTASPKWCRVAGYPSARVTVDPVGNSVTVDLSRMPNPPASLVVWAQTNEMWPKGPGDNWS
jgi:hypothetical protein